MPLLRSPGSAHDGGVRRLATLITVLGTMGLVVSCAGAPQATTSPGSAASVAVRTETASAGPTTMPTTATSNASASATPSTTSSAVTTPSATPTVGRDAWVAVSVATLWRTPSSPRAVDQAALTNPAAIRTWLSGLTIGDRRGLNGRAETQVLLGDRVVVTARNGSWARVVAPSQPTPLDSRGYPGWVPLVQLTATSPAPSALQATVVSRTAWLRTDDSSAAAVTEVSYGTRLPQLGVSGGWVRVGVPPGRVLRVAATDVSVTAWGASAVPAGGTELVRSATMFTGLAYLWAGTSGFGFDCSGLTSLIYRVHGITIPRDADAQTSAGRAAAPSALQPGDLLFYATDGVVHHVSMYAGNGQMVHAANTGSSVATIPISTPAYAVEFAGARRYLG